MSGSREGGRAPTFLCQLHHVGVKHQGAERLEVAPVLEDGDLLALGAAGPPGQPPIQHVLHQLHTHCGKGPGSGRAAAVATPPRGSWHPTHGRPEGLATLYPNTPGREVFAHSPASARPGCRSLMGAAYWALSACRNRSTGQV